MTAPDETMARRLDRRAGGCLIAVGVLLLTTVPHPDVFETTFADAALDTPSWVVTHAALVVAAILSIFGLAGVYLPRADRLGRLGAAGFALAVPGLVVAACLFYWEAFLLPVIARHAPEVFAWDGPVVGSWGVRTGALAGLWFVGLVLLAVAMVRSGVVPRVAGLTLAASAVAFAAFEGPFVPVLGVLSTVALAASHAWVGLALWTGATGRVVRAGAGRVDPESGAGIGPATTSRLVRPRRRPIGREMPRERARSGHGDGQGEPPTR